MWVLPACLKAIYEQQMDTVNTNKDKNRLKEKQQFSHNILPGNAPVRFNSQDSGVISVVKLDLWVSELGVVDVH